jgi:hypothetical protein
MNDLEWLEDWYARHCFQDEDDPWEEQYGVKIDTLDNPGWFLIVDLVGTELEGRVPPNTQDERSEHDWIHVFVRDGQFNGVGGPRNLVEIVREFRRWATSP